MKSACEEAPQLVLSFNSLLFNCSKGKPQRSEFAKSFTAPSVCLINSKTVLTFGRNLIKTSTREMHTAVTLLEVASGLSASKPKSGIKAFDDEI